VWKGRTYPVDALPDELPAAAARAIDMWSGWVDEHGYRMALDPEGRVLLVSDRSTGKTMQLVAETVRFFDERLPAPPRDEVDGRPLGVGGTGSAGSGAIPEDPDEPIPEDPDEEGEPPGDDLQRALYGWTEQWGSGSLPLDQETITLLSLNGEDDYGSVLDHLAGLAPYLAAWVEPARGNLGFVLEQPLCGAWVHGGAGQEEWSPEGELVHRLSELLLTRRFGRQPYWLVQGWAWHAEMELRGAIYCYPYRDEFVYEVEHAAWPADLRALAAEPDTFGVSSVSALRRGAWSGRDARLAFGTVAWMASERVETLPPLLESLRAAWDEGSRVDLGGGDWERNVDYEVETKKQDQLLRRHIGDDLWTELAAYWRGS
jgi:hypothetical protein